MKYYQVLFLDEENNLWEVGNFSSLKAAESELNKYLEDYTLAEDSEEAPGETPEFGEGKNLRHLVEYSSAFNNCFDRLIYTEEGSLYVRGFIKDTQETIEEMKSLEGLTK